MYSKVRTLFFSLRIHFQFYIILDNSNEFNEYRNAISTSANITYDNLPEWENSDDSIKDPDFIINNTVTSSDSHPESEKSEVLDIPFNYDDPQSKIKNKKRLCQTLRNTGKSYKTLSGKVNMQEFQNPLECVEATAKTKFHSIR